MSTMLALRAYLTGSKIAELEYQLRDARKHFPNARVIAVLCGQEATDSIRQLADEVIHYSTAPTGLTAPWRITIERARQFRPDLLVMMDGDDQHIMAEVARVVSAMRADILVAKRQQRTVFVGDKDLHGPTLEDVENAFVRTTTKCAIQDLQSGVFALSRNALEKFDFANVHAWVGDLAFSQQACDSGLSIECPPLDVRSQQHTISNRELVFKSVEAYEKHFNISFDEVLTRVEANPAKYLVDGRLAEVAKIKDAFREYEGKRRVKNMKGLILAGGHGLRLRPITHTIQKQLIPVANKPIIYYAIEDLVRAGIVDIGIIVGPNKEQVKEVVGNGARWNCRISYIEQDAPKGLAHAVWTAKEFIDKSDFVMYLGDNLLRGGIDNFVSNFALTRPAASIMLTPVPDPQRFGVARLDEQGNVAQLLEKPKNPPSNLAIVGIYAFTQEIMEAIQHITPSARGELEITDAMQWLLLNGQKVTKELVNGWWKDTGEAEALLHANQLMLDDAVTRIEGNVEEGAKVSGRVIIGKDTLVKSGAVVRGPAIIGENCTIGEGVFIGPNTAIGDGCTIERSEVEHAIILRNCALLNAGRLTDSVIGQNSVIKAGTKRVPAATTLILGDNSSVELP